jgi:hypothetical protein
MTLCPILTSLARLQYFYVSNQCLAGTIVAKQVDKWLDDYGYLGQCAAERERLQQTNRREEAFEQARTDPYREHQ